MSVSTQLKPGLVSIIIPTYNRAELLVRSVRSVLEQDYPHKQIIVIDDGSTDDTRERLAAFPEVEYRWQEHQRQAAARNLGLQCASGDYIASLDSDDFWEPSFLSQSMSTLAGSDLGFVFSLWNPAGPTYVPEWRFNSRLRALNDLKHYEHDPRGGWFHLTPSQTRSLFIRHCWAPSSSLVLRRNLIEQGWNTQLRVSDDWMLLLNLILKKAPACAFRTEALWTKWLDGTNILDHSALGGAGRAQNEIHDNHIILREFAPLMTVAERRLVRQRLSRSYCDLGYHTSVGGRCKESLRVYLNAFRYHPSQRPLIEMFKALLRQAVNPKQGSEIVPPPSGAPPTMREK